MLGAIIGDIAGSFREFTKKNKFPELGLIPDPQKIIGLRCGITDDSLLTMATGYACIEFDGNPSIEQFASVYHNIGNQYNNPIGGFGGVFRNWLSESDKKPYNSCGNGSAMRVSPVAYVGKTLADVRQLAFNSACATHNHPEGIKGAQATAIMIYLTRKGKTIKEISDELYDMKLHYEPIEQFDHFDSICQETMRLVMHCLLTTDNFHDAVFKAVTIPNADSDTVGAIVGSIAEPLYGIPQEYADKAISMILPELMPYYIHFKNQFITNG